MLYTVYDKEKWYTVYCIWQGQMLYAVYDKGKCYINDTRKCCKVQNFEPEI